MVTSLVCPDTPIVITQAQVPGPRNYAGEGDAVKKMHPPDDPRLLKLG